MEAPPSAESAAPADGGSEALLNTLFARAPIGLAFVDTELRFVRINAHLAELNGPSVEEHLGRTLADVLPELAPLVTPLYQQVLATGEAICDVEIHSAPPSTPDQPRDWLSSYYPVPDAEGRIIGLGVVVVEITAQKQAEAALQRQAATLREHEEQLLLAHDAAELGMWRHDLATDTFRLGPRAQAHYGFTQDTVTADEVLARVHPDDLGRLQQEITSTMYPAGKRRYHTEYRVFHPDGSVHWLAVRARVYGPGWGGPGTEGFGTGTSQDITAQKQAEEELRRMAEHLRMLNLIDRAILAAQTPEQIAHVVVTHLQQFVPCDRVVISAYDPEHQRLQRLAKSSQSPAPTDAGQPLPIEPCDLLPPYQIAERWYIPDIDRVEVFSPRAITCQALGLRSLMNFPLIAEGQLLGILRLGSERADAFRERDIALVGDVADQLAIALRGARLRAQLEQERALLARRVAERTADLSAANADLAQAARVKDEFLSNMSHELRTPLNAILGRTELLREQIYGPLVPQQDAAIQGIAEAGQHLLGLINDILDLSKVEAGKLSLELVPLEVEAVGRAAVRMVSELALSRKIALTTTYDAQVERVLADERRLKQILVNLLSNAVKFTPEGGKVGLEIQADPERQAVTFTVWDTGIGIAPQDQARLFQPFVQIDSSLSREHEGTGLGLALVLRLTELHNGSVALESAPGQGSRFSVTLPWSGPGAPTASAPAASHEQGPGSPLAIRQALVIEDSQTAVEQLRRYLGDLGSRVEVHDRAMGAVERACELQPDLIVLDILLPDQPGWEVLRQLKADPRTAAIPVLVASVVEDPGRARDLGAAGFVLKPLTRDHFLAALRALHHSAERVEQHAFPLALVVIPQATETLPVVLLVDDNEANLQVLVDYLPTAGYEVVVARNGAEAVALAEEINPAVIVMDIQMPVLDGLEATRRIRAAGLRDTPILALTALAMAGDRERCLEAGADAYLSKPVSIRALIDLIKAIER